MNPTVHASFPSSLRRAAATALLAAASLPAQAPAGSAVLLVDAPPTLIAVDPTGVQTPVAGLDPATAAASAICFGQGGVLFVGLRARNTGAGAQLGVRFLLLAGGAAVDLPLANLMAVPANQEWEVADIAARDDGSLLVLARQTGVNPVQNVPAQVFTVDIAGNVQAVPIAAPGFGLGLPTSIADLGDRYAVAIDQPFFVRNFEIDTLRYDGTGSVDNVAQFVSVQTWGGMARDIAGELVAAAPHGGVAGSLFRLLPQPGASIVAVPGGTRQFAATADNGAGLMGAVLQTAVGPELVRIDTVLGTATPWLSGIPQQVLDLAVVPNPEIYGRQLAAATPELGAQGGRPSLPNGTFALRMAAPDTGLALFFGAAAQAVVATPFGTLLLNPGGTILTFGFAAVAPGSLGTVGLPLPADPALQGVPFFFQAALLPASGALPQLSSGLGVVLGS